MKWYVVLVDCNSRKPVIWNIFNNIVVDERIHKELKRYLRAPSKYKIWYDPNLNGIDALKTEIDLILKGEFWGRYEYECCVIPYSSIEIESNYKYRIDVYEQLRENIDAITHECIRQYKEEKKNGV